MRETDRPARESLAAFDVSRETCARLEVLVAELVRWQRIQNLVGSSHACRSLDPPRRGFPALLDLAPNAGPGSTSAPAPASLASSSPSPGLERGTSPFIWWRATRRKCAFLRVARLPGGSVTVTRRWLKRSDPGLRRTDVVSARALAPLAQLIVWTEPLLKTGTTGLFPKGVAKPAELTESRKSETFAADISPSRPIPKPGSSESLHQARADDD